MELSPPTLPAYSHQPTPYTGLSKEEILSLRTQYVNPVVAPYYQQPIAIVEGSMQYVYDEMGRRYLDGFAGIATVNVGHCHPHVVQAIQTQSAQLQHTTTLYLHPTLAEYSKMLAETFPDPLSVVYLVNSGSEANDLALLMSRVYTGNFEAIVLRNGYHGMGGYSMGMTSQSTWKYHPPHNVSIHHAMNADPYRGPWTYGDRNAAHHYASEIQNLIQHATCGQIAAFIAEAIQGVGGTVVYPDGYLKKVQMHIHAAGGLFIADEVQTGFGRTGTMWGFEHHGIVPDIVTLAKGIGNGYPLAAVVTTPDIAQAFTQKIHFNTYAGNPVACSAGKAVLEAIEKDDSLANCQEVGRYLFNRLKELQNHYEVIGDVRGMGLMIGVDLVKDRQTKEPYPELAAHIHEKAKDLGLLIGKGGLYRNVLRIKPPLCISKNDAEFTVQVLDFIFKS